MKSLIWGPYAWYLLHWLSFTFQPEKINVYHSIFKQLEKILPCPVCRNHYIKKIQNDFKIDRIKDKNTFIYWVYNLHNNVNKTINKPQFPFSSVIQLYFPNKTKINYSPKPILIFLLCCYHDYLKTGNKTGLEILPEFLKNICQVFPFDSQKKICQFVEQNPPEKNKLDIWIRSLFLLFKIDFHDPLIPTNIANKLFFNKYSQNKIKNEEKKNDENDKNNKNDEKLWTDLNIEELLKNIII